MITMLGDGAWGTAVANTLAVNGHKVILWCFNEKVARSISELHENKCYLPGIKLSRNITPTTNLEKALESQIIFQAIPVKFMRSTIEKCKKDSRENQLWVSLSKGIENNTLMLPTQIIQNILGKNIKSAAVSGPSYAVELAKKAPTIVTIASEKKDHSKKIGKLLANDFLSFELSDDTIGVQIGGATKNVFAIGIGILESTGYSANTQARFMMEAISEIKELTKKLGGKEETFYKSSGIGDFILTCFNEQSRNRQVGTMIGKGKKLEKILKETGYIPEGVNSVKSLLQIAKKRNIKLPLSKKIHDIIFENRPSKILIMS